MDALEHSLSPPLSGQSVRLSLRHQELGRVKVSTSTSTGWCFVRGTGGTAQGASGAVIGMDNEVGRLNQCFPLAPSRLSGGHVRVELIM
jgi:hypothetical protein